MNRKHLVRNLRERATRAFPPDADLMIAAANEIDRLHIEYHLLAEAFDMQWNEIEQLLDQSDGIHDPEH